MDVNARGWRISAKISDFESNAAHLNPVVIIFSFIAGACRST
jgi:hypothetical protein